MTRKQKNASRRRRRLKEEKINEYFLSKLCIIKNEIPSFKKKEEISIRQTTSGERREGQEKYK